MRMDIMVDIETLGNKTDSTIFQIAAVAFDIETGKHLQTFQRIADISSNKTLNVTGDTLKWWLNTNKELLSDLLNQGQYSSEDLLIEFSNWMMSIVLHHDAYLWGNGILFDNKMIQHQLESIGITYPIFYRNDRDVRTIVELASHKTGLTEKELRKKYYDSNTEAHNAAHDVANQIRLVTACYEELIK